MEGYIRRYSSMYQCLTSDGQTDISRWLQMAHLAEKCSIESVTIKPASRLAALVTLDDGRAFFFKKKFENEALRDHGRTSITEERDIFTFIQNSKDLYHYREVMPAMHAYLEEEGLLITEGLQGYVSLKEFYDQWGCY